jgi:MGT family glycosyltransferase
VVNRESGDLFSRVLSGLRDLGPDLIVTVGEGIDPAELGPQPAHVHVERHVDQALVLPHCRAVVSHGGSGSVLGALSHGLPSVLLPISADQPLNAQRCAELGLGLELDAVHATPAEIRDAVTTVLGDPAHRAAAERVRDEIAALPGPEHAVALLSRL